MFKELEGHAGHLDSFGFVGPSFTHDTDLCRRTVIALCAPTPVFFTVTEIGTFLSCAMTRS